MCHLSRKLLVLLVAVLAGLREGAAQEELKHIPAETLGVVRIASIDRLAEDSHGLIYDGLLPQLKLPLPEGVPPRDKGRREITRTLLDAFAVGDGQAFDTSKPCYWFSLPLELPMPPCVVLPSAPVIGPTIRPLPAPGSSGRLLPVPPGPSTYAPLQTDPGSRYPVVPVAPAESDYAPQSYPAVPVGPTEPFRPAEPLPSEAGPVPIESPQKPLPLQAIPKTIVPGTVEGTIAPPATWDPYATPSVPQPPAGPLPAGLFQSRSPVVYLVFAPDFARLRRAVLGVKENGAVKLQPRADGFIQATAKGKTWYFAHRGNWTLYTQHVECVDYLTDVKQGDKTFDQVLPPAARQVFLSGNVSAAFCAGIWIEKMKPELADYRKFAMQGIETLDLSSPDWSMVKISPEQFRAGLRRCADVAFEGFLELQTVAGNIELGKEGIRGSGVLTVKSGGQLDRLFRSHQGTALATTGRLPKGALAYYGCKCEPDVWKAMLKLYALGVEDAESRMKSKAITTWLESAPQEYAGALSPEHSATEGFPGFRLMSAANPKKLCDSKKTVAGDSGDVRTWYEESFEEHRGLRVDLVTEKRDFTPDKEEGEDEDGAFDQVLNRIMETVCGTRPREFRVAALDDLVVEVSGHKGELFRRYIDKLAAGQSSAQGDPAFQRTRKALDAKANLLVMLHLPSVVRKAGVETIRHMPGAAYMLGKIPAGKPGERPESYTGLSFSMVPGAARVRWVMPAAEFRAMQTYLELSGASMSPTPNPPVPAPSHVPLVSPSIESGTWKPAKVEGVVVPPTGTQLR